jgi:hypothetical protein
VYRLDRVIRVEPEWALIVGDAVQNLRSALDHLMWQLAKRHLSRVPTEQEAKSIQFPEVRRVKDFAGNRYLRYIDTTDVARLKPYQPYKRLNRGELHPLPKLIRLSNIDKHRRLHLLVPRPFQSPLTNRPDAYRDCVPRFELMPNGNRASIVLNAPPPNPRPNHPILIAYVDVIGPNPDANFDMTLTGFVGLGRLGPIVPLLDGMAQYVTAVLDAFS